MLKLEISTLGSEISKSALPIYSLLAIKVDFWRRGTSKNSNFQFRGINSRALM
jgi:hypothetical protein